MKRPTSRSGITSHSLPGAGALVGKLQQYFGIDLQRLPDMSDEELGQIADRAHEMKRLVELLPILEKHFEVLISGQLAYEEFVNRVLKDADKAGRKIDKLMLDSWLLNRGYQQHQAQMKQSAGLGAMVQDAEHASAMNLNQLDSMTALKLVRLRHQRKEAQIKDKLPEAIRAMQFQEQQRIANQQRRELLTNGTQARSRKGWGQRMSDFFGGR